MRISQPFVLKGRWLFLFVIYVSEMQSDEAYSARKWPADRPAFDEYIIIYYDLELLDLHIPFSIHIHLLIRSDIGIPFVYHHHQIHSVRPKWINTETEILVKFTEPKTKIQKQNLGDIIFFKYI